MSSEQVDRLTPEEAEERWPNNVLDKMHEPSCALKVYASANKCNCWIDVIKRLKQSLAEAETENERLLRDVLHRVQVAHEYPEKGDIAAHECPGDECEICYGILPLVTAAFEDRERSD